MTLRSLTITALLLALGALGGGLAALIHLPLPWMLGSLIASGLVVAFAQARLGDYHFPLPFRTAFVALIGVMIGTQVTPDLFSLGPTLALTFAGLAVFVTASHAGNYLIFRRVGGFDRATAFYAGTPGGLMESILMGESAGADVRLITVQQFLRIILVIVSVPVGLSLYLGHPVGSAAGQSLGGGGAVPLTQIPLIGGAAVGGLWLARMVHLPAAQLVGPLLLSGALTLSGLVDLHLPRWLISMAQVVIGVSLGLRFRGVSARLLRRSLGLACLSVALMIVLGATLSELLLQLTGLKFLHLFISFAPGGVTEMSVIALSLAANPALVSLHHVARILMTVVEMTIGARWLKLDRSGT